MKTNCLSEVKYMKEVKFTVNDMSCGHCKLAIEKELKKSIAVKSIEIDLNNKIVKINYDDDILDIADLKRAIKEAGYYEI
ncbi:heavy metal-associated domain-containing protein [Halanaerocella petrolearia]